MRSLIGSCRDVLFVALIRSGSSEYLRRRRLRYSEDPDSFSSESHHDHTDARVLDPVFIGSMGPDDRARFLSHADVVVRVLQMSFVIDFLETPSLRPDAPGKNVADRVTRFLLAFSNDLPDRLIIFRKLRKQM